MPLIFKPLTPESVQASLECVPGDSIPREGWAPILAVRQHGFYLCTTVDADSAVFLESKEIL